MKKSAADQERAFQRKWGSLALKAGWVGIPTILLQHQGKLGLTPTDIVVLAHMIRFWWTKEQLPFPSLERMAEEMGVSVETVVSSVARLQDMKLLEVVRREGLPDAYDLAGLVTTLEEVTEQRLRGGHRE